MRSEDHRIIKEEGIKPRVYEEDDYEYNETGELVLKKYTGTTVRNPNGSNQFIQDPRQELCWKLYIQGLSKGQPNAKGAALKAGYSPNTAINIGKMKWFKDNKAKLRKKNMLTRAEFNLSKLLRTEFTGIKINDKGEEVEEFDIDKAKLVKDVSIFIAETIGKDEGYSKKIEEDKNVSHDIKIESVNYANVIDIPNETQELIKEAVVDEIKNE